MKIALIAPPLLLTPPAGYGGLERVVYDLGEALVAMGEDVTLIAPKGSSLPGGKVIETIPAAGTVSCNWMEKEGQAFNVYKGMLGQFDVIHSHEWFGFSYLARITEEFGKDLRMLHTHHGHCDWCPTAVPPEIAPVCLVGISAYMQVEYATMGWKSRYVYNGIDLNTHPFQEEKGDDFVFVGRLSKFKQPDLAIEAALGAGKRIHVIGGSFVVDPAYLDMIRKKCEASDGRAILHLDATHEEKVKLVQNARACLIPSQMQEPFGLVCVESFSTGTPAIALNDGALSELVTPKAGIVANNNVEFFEAVKNFDTEKFDPKDCRQRAEYFSREKMADRYLKLYREVIDGPGW